MKRKIMVSLLLAITIMLLVPIGISFASKPVKITSVMFLNAEIITSVPVGMNVISERELVGSFTSGPFEGNIYREIRVVIHTKTGKVTVQNIVYVEDAVVTIDGVVAEGSFVMKVMGMVGNAKWTIIRSDLTAEGEPVKLHGQGTAAVTAFIFVDPTHYDIENTLTGQVAITP